MATKPIFGVGVNALFLLISRGGNDVAVPDGTACHHNPAEPRRVHNNRLESTTNTFFYVFSEFPKFDTVQVTYYNKKQGNQKPRLVFIEK